MRIRAQKRSKLTKRKTLLNSFETCERKGLAQPNVPTPHQAPKARRPANHPPAREPAAFPCSAMLLQLIPVLHVAFTLRGTRAQSVTQPNGHITVSERDRLELRCNYSSSVPPYLFWYVQYPNQGLQLLLKYTSGNNLVPGIKGFEAEFKKSETSFHLKKPSAHWSDSAQYFCSLSDTVPGTAGGAARKPPETLGTFCDSRTQERIFKKIDLITDGGLLMNFSRRNTPTLPSPLPH
ncbi:T cell receptor alpha variable 8-3 [Manis javanica]|nr:T cell receptor alpha variable 8-3 [Manis javanica]